MADVRVSFTLTLEEGEEDPADATGVTAEAHERLMNEVMAIGGENITVEKA